VPIQAVTSRDDTLGLFVIAPDAGRGTRVQWVPVETGIQDNLHIAITSAEGVDLNESTEVVTGPYDQVARKLEDDALVEKKSVDEDEDSDDSGL